MNTFREKFDKLKNYQPPADWLNISTIDAHTAGEPLRIITGGFPELLGNTILEKRKFLKEKYDFLRTALMWEPRGHADQYGCMITPPVNEGSDFGVIFLHNEGYSTMCGHGIIAVSKVALETGLVDKQLPETMIKIDSPAGLITAFVRFENGKISDVYFYNVPSFVYKYDQTVIVKGLGEVKFDIAFGGAFYAFVNASEVGLKLEPDEFRNIIDKGMLIKNAVMENFEITHPFEKDLSFLYGTIFIDDTKTATADSRNVCVFANGEVDRSPTGTGVSARMALHYFRNELKINEPMVIESILGTPFTASVHEVTKFGGYDAVIPKVQGNAFIIGKNEFYLDPEDILKNGFILR